MLTAPVLLVPWALFSDVTQGTAGPFPSDLQAPALLMVTDALAAHSGLQRRHRVYARPAYGRGTLPSYLGALAAQLLVWGMSKHPASAWTCFQMFLLGDQRVGCGWAALAPHPLQHVRNAVA